MPRGLRALLVVVMAAMSAVLVAGCTDKSSAAATSDATTILQGRFDAGNEHESSPSAPNASAFEDTAMPASSGDDLQTRMRHLLEAISQNSPELAMDALFPRDAYVASKDSADPQKAWEKQASLPFHRACGRMHKRMKGIERAKFVSFELGRSIVQITPKRRDFKKPLWRVKHSKLTFTIDGRVRHLDIAEMMAWRGAWYVTRLR